MQLDLDPLTLAFIGVSSEKDIKKFDKIYNEENPEWVLEWLSYKGLTEWKNYAKQNYFGVEHHA